MISVIIPALNEERALPATLSCLFEQPGEFEVILVDGGSYDRTVELAKRWPEVKILATAAGRAQQMNKGAAEASGELLLFLHADTRLPVGSIKQLAALVDDPGFAWGGFHQAFSGSGYSLRFISWLTNARCLLTRVFYGDQAMFVCRSVFVAAGGFPEGLLEDIRLSQLLKREHKPVFLPDRVVTDSRKFEQLGPFRSLGLCLIILACHGLRLPLLGQRFFSPVR